MEDEFIQNQERLKPQEEKNEVMKYPSGVYTSLEMTPWCGVQNPLTLQLQHLTGKLYQQLTL